MAGIGRDGKAQLAQPFAGKVDIGNRQNEMIDRKRVLAHRFFSQQ
jgi:hypothetical protein